MPNTPSLTVPPSCRSPLPLSLSAEATFLSRFGSHVYIIVRRDVLRASKIMQERARNHPKITFLWNSHVTAAKGEKLLQSVTVKNKDGSEQELAVAGLFFAIGHEPASAFLGGQITLDEDKYIVTTPGTTQTNVPGVFAAGDVQDKRWRQAITAAGTGCMAALEAEHFLVATGAH